jgi:O-acetyl-ADP-ribose deacetylase (regulator of RNase III)
MITIYESKTIINDTTITVAQNGVLRQDVDVIVNAANTGMRGGGGLDGAVHDKAGSELLLELIRLAPNGVETSEVILTKGYGCKQPYIIHAAGPIWQGGAQKEEQELRDTYLNCLLEADEHEDITSIAFCCLSTGIYGFPKKEAPEFAIDTVYDYLLKYPQTSIKKVVFATFNEEDYEVYKKTMSSVGTRLQLNEQK